MKPEVANALNFALQYLRNGNLGAAKKILNQISKRHPNNVEVLKLLGITLALHDENKEALNVIEKATKYFPTYGALYLVKGNILSDMSRLDEALASYEQALKLNSGDWESHNNKGNVLQKAGRYQEAILSYDAALSCGGDSSLILSNVGNAFQKLKDFNSAIRAYDAVLKLNPNDYEIYSNKGNALVAIENYDAAKEAYFNAIRLCSNYSDAHLNLANLYLTQFNFDLGWREYEWRFSASEGAKMLLNVDLPRWNGCDVDSLLVIGEQGIGDQILHASMLKHLGSCAKEITIILDDKLINIFSRSLPQYKFCSKDSDIDLSKFEAYIPIGGLGQYFRGGIEKFADQAPFLTDSKRRTNDLIRLRKLTAEKTIGISWVSSNKMIGQDKSMALKELTQIFASIDAQFISLQYGDTKLERDQVEATNGVSVEEIDGIDLYDDIDGLLSIISLCDVVVTTSNTTAHLAGALGRETLLLLPRVLGKFWYWQDIDNMSLWYPSVKVFHQEKQGDWAIPIKSVKEYLEKRFAR